MNTPTRKYQCFSAKGQGYFNGELWKISETPDGFSAHSVHAKHRIVSGSDEDVIVAAIVHLQSTPQPAQEAPKSQP